MKLDGKLLKKLILEVIEEGRQEKKWIAQQPKEEQEQWLSAEQQGLKLSDLAWIKKVRGGEPIQDIVGDVLYFRRQDVQKKLKDNGFETNLSKKTYPTVNDLRRLIKNVSDAEESDVKYDEILRDPSQVELLGKVGNWEILMPLTQRGSVACDISGKDTTWCTQKKSGQNLFYSYVGRKNEDIILFYVMDYSRTPNLEGKDADARLSIGFAEGKPVLKGQSGGLSVDAENNGLTNSHLKSYLGNDYSEIMNTLQAKAIQIGSKHPAKEMIKKAAQNILLLKQMAKDYKEEERRDFYKQILKQDKISSKVLAFLAKDGDNFTRNLVAQNPNTPPEVLAFLAKDGSHFTRTQVAANPNTPPEVLAFLAKDENRYVRRPVAENPNTPPEALALLAKDEDRGVRTYLAENPNTPPEVLAFLAKDEDSITRTQVAANPNTPPEVLAFLAKDGSHFTRNLVAQNPNTPQEALALLAKDEDDRVRKFVAQNPNTPKDQLQESKRYKIKILK